MVVGTVGLYVVLVVVVVGIVGTNLVVGGVEVVGEGGNSVRCQCGEGSWTTWNLVGIGPLGRRGNDGLNVVTVGVVLAVVGRSVLVVDSVRGGGKVVVFSNGKIALLVK